MTEHFNLSEPQQKPPRVMWLLNHGAARRFEIPMLKRMGIREIFLPKQFPNDPAFRSASIDHSEDVNLSIAASELEILNGANWYGSPGKRAWDLANKYFDVLFFILHDAETLQEILKNFRGVILWRAYGSLQNSKYSDILSMITEGRGEGYIAQLGARFFFAEAYDSLHTVEEPYLAQRQLYLPLGIDKTEISVNWKGSDKRIFFICPDIGFNPYYRAVYERFRADFKSFDYLIGGSQPLPVPDPRVIGFTPDEAHQRNMRELCVMFYHSTEPNHVHYHPFEAIRAGMPLIYMKGGILERFAGRSLPGQCSTIKEAQNKIRRIIKGDKKLIKAIKLSQAAILEQMKPERCLPHWEKSFQKIFSALDSIKTQAPPCANPKKPRVAIIIPVEYRGGSLRGAKLFANAIARGSRDSGDTCEVIFAHLDDTKSYPAREFVDLDPCIKRRAFRWQTLSKDEARRALNYAKQTADLVHDEYCLPNDGINQLLDCDFWIIISDRVSKPILPLRPYAVMVYDYTERYVDVNNKTNELFIGLAHAAERVFVTTEFTRNDALQFAALEPKKVVKLPMLAPALSSGLNKTARVEGKKKKSNAEFFLWTTNLAPHKNHATALEALRIYYEEFSGSLHCFITGVNTERLFKGNEPHLIAAKSTLEKSKKIKAKLQVLGELSDFRYLQQLAAARFLWHAGEIDNGTFSVVEAARYGVPSLSSDYPAMREIDKQFTLGLTWMDPYDPDDMARQLMLMEERAASFATPTVEQLNSQSVEKLAIDYWKAVRTCL